MKTSTRAMGTSLLFLCGLLANESAMAQHRGHMHGHGPTVRFGYYYGFPIYAPRYFSVPVYAYPGYALPAPVQVFPPAIISYSSPPVYIERGVVPIEPAAPVQNDWYYCAASQTYYPYVRECPGGWQRVPAQPPSR